VKSKHPDTVVKGRDLFDATLFKEEATTRVFYTFMAELKSVISSAVPTPTHSFIRQLQDNGQLLRCYTQNIDCLEELVDLPVVQLHGSMNKVKCTVCTASYGFSSDHQEQFRDGTPPPCPKCQDLCDERTRLGKRSLATGILRPDIVLYNEEHPWGESIGQMQFTDLKKRPDLMIVMGTSLKIPALKKFIKQAARVIHSNKNGRVVFVNRTPCTKEWEKVFDYEILSDTDEWVSRMQTFTQQIQQELALKRKLSVSTDYLESEKENVIIKSIKKTKSESASDCNKNSSSQTTLDGLKVTKNIKRIFKKSITS
jgi:NAD-dependent histone deacetylase SIR2